MKILFILNDPPYGTERNYNGLRLANALKARADVTVRVFLMGDAASCAKAGQRVPAGYYNLENMLSLLARHGGEIGVCGSCMDARGLTESDLASGARRSSMNDLVEWCLWADRILTF